MKINLQTDENLKIIIDETCEFVVWGERNKDGTMEIKSKWDGK